VISRVSGYGPYGAPAKLLRGSLHLPNLLGVYKHEASTVDHCGRSSSLGPAS